MDAQSEVFTPLPEKLIQTAKGAEDKMKNMDPTRTMSNNPIEEQENNMCITCKEEEMCGVYATTRAMAKRQTEAKVEEYKVPKIEELTKGRLPIIWYGLEYQGTYPPKANLRHQ